MKRVMCIVISMMLIFLNIQVSAYGSIENPVLNLSVNRILDQSIIEIIVELSFEQSADLSADCIKELNKDFEVTLKVLDAENKENFLEQSYTDNEGKCKFSYKNNGENGNYYITARIPDLNITAKSTFKQTDFNTLNAVYEIIMAESRSLNPNLTSIRTNFEDNMENFGIEKTIYDTILNKDTVYKIFVEDKKTLEEATDIAHLQQSLYSAMVIAKINETHSGETVENLISDKLIKSVFDKENILPGGIASEKTVFDEFSKKLQGKVCTAIAKDTYKNKDQLKNALLFHTLSTGISSAENWVDVVPLMKKYSLKQHINVDFKTYESLKSPDVAIKAMMNIIYYTFNDIEKRFEDLCNAAYNKEHQKPQQPGSVGNAGGTVHFPKPTPAENIPVIPVQDEINKGKPIFSDMEYTKWAIDAVNALYEKGIIQGKADNVFAPNDYVTRNEVAKMVTNFLELDITKYKENTKKNVFGDVLNDSWCYPYVMSAYDAGIINGKSDDYFGGEDFMNREEMACLIHRIVKKTETTPTVTSLTPFEDEEDISEWAKESANYLKSTKIMVGRTGNIFDGKANLTRAETANVIYKLLNLKGE